MWKSICLGFYFILLLIKAEGQQKDTTSYFEGYIDYTTEFKSKMAGVSDNGVKEWIGHSIRIYYKKEVLKWVFKDSLGFVKSYFITNGKTGMQYSWSKDSPNTLFSINASTGAKQTKLDSMEEVGTEEVLGCKCRIGKFSTTNIYENPPHSEPTIYSYYFCPDIKTDPKLFENYKEMSWDKIIKKYKSVALKMVTQFEAFSSIFTATEIHPEIVDPKVFAIDKTKFIKPEFVD